MSSKKGCGDADAGEEGQKKGDGDAEKRQGAVAVAAEVAQAEKKAQRRTAEEPEVPHEFEERVVAPEAAFPRHERDVREEHARHERQPDDAVGIGKDLALPEPLKQESSQR